MSDIQIFDQRGKLRAAESFNETELESLSPEKRESFDRLRLTAAIAEQAEADVKAAIDAVADAARQKAEAEAELRRVRPPRTFAQEWAAMKAQGRQ